MRDFKKDIPYIDGSMFSSTYKFEIKEKHPNLSRTDLLMEKTKGKKVVHVGCVDHINLIDEKIKSGNYLHEVLTNNTLKCLGIDINKEGIKLLQEKYKYTNVIFADLLTNEIEEISNEQWDYIILGEILEHVDNPVIFLNKIKEKYKSTTDNIVITVPNVININTFRKVRREKGEFINSDHRYWFSPYTILKVLYMAGIRPISLEFSNRIRLNNLELQKKRLYKYILRKKLFYNYYYFNTIIVTGEL